MRQKDANTIMEAVVQVLRESFARKSHLDSVNESVIDLAETCTELRSRVAELERQLAELRKT